MITVITVAILINGQPLMARSATRTRKRGPGYGTLYRVDDGTEIEHDPDEGAVALAIEMLRTIKNQEQKR